jgi:diguanylate cyclase (GGDEF)-like protein
MLSKENAFEPPLNLICTRYFKLIIKLLSQTTIAFSLLLSFPIFAQQNNQQVLNYCVDPDWVPFEGLVDGKHIGIANDYLKIFLQLTDFKFNLVTTSSWTETTESLKSGKCDLTLMLNSSVEREKYLSFTMPYFFGPNVLVSKKGIPFMQDLPAVKNMTLGVVSGYRLVDDISKYYPEINLVTVPSEEQGLLAVDQAKIDVYVGSLYSVNLNINQLELSSLKINGWISLQDKLRIGVTKSNEYLIPIFNQAIDKISSSQHNEILNRWSKVQFVKQTDYALLYYLGIVASIIFLIFLWRHFVSKKVLTVLSIKNRELEKIREELLVANKNLEYLSFHDQLTKLYNRHYFISTLNDHISQLVRQGGKSALLMIDLDYFKKINDEYGHMVGDKILAQFSSVLSNELRASDVAARWGGEEFIVLLANSNEDHTIALASRLIKAVEEQTFESNIYLTISIGVSLYQENDSLELWIERADTALYQAKHEGRNRIKVIN